MSTSLDFSSLYAQFDAPILDVDCGAKCAPYNGGVPVCCDTRHSVPTAYTAEWVYLQNNTDLWHPWEPDEVDEHARLASEAGPELVLIECLGAAHCQRDYRSLVCRAFPFFPYVDSAGRFLGLSYYSEYEDRCWVLSNLGRVSSKYRNEFIQTYEKVFDARPDEKETFQKHSAHMRSEFKKNGRSVPLLHRDGRIVMITPLDEIQDEIEPEQLSKHGPFEIADTLLFPDEM